MVRFVSSGSVSLLSGLKALRKLLKLSTQPGPAKQKCGRLEIRTQANR